MARDPGLHADRVALRVDLKSKLQDLKVFLMLQLAAAGLALVSFRLIEVRWQAALLAASGFLMLGGFMVVRTLRWPRRFSYLTFYFGRIHTYLFALPMIIVRVRFWGLDFKELHFLGIPAPLFHRASEIFYLVLVAGTLIDWVRVRWTLARVMREE